MLIDYRVRQREYLLAISRALTAELDLADVLRIIVQASVEFISAKAGMILLTDPAENVIRVAAIYGLPRDQYEQFLPVFKSISYRNGEEQETLTRLTRSVQKIAERSEIGVSQVLRLPLVSGDSLIGMIYVFQEASYRISSEAAGLLQSFADQAAIAVRNARLYQEVNEEKRRLDAILSQSGDGIMILDRRLHITGFNPAVSRLAGWSAEDAIGKKHEEIIKWAKLESDQTLEMAISNGWPLPGAANLYVEGELQRQEGNTISIGITYAPLMNNQEAMTNIIANIRDLTKYKEEQELQKTFISIVSHELKTPVSIIKGYAGTLMRRDTEWSPRLTQEYAGVIEEEADRLTELIDNLLEASRFQSGMFRLELADDVSMPRLAADTVARFESQTDKHEFKIAFPPDFPVIRGDEKRLTQVLNNLVSNAIKYSPDGGPIELFGNVQGDYVTISVRDQGIGIPEYEGYRIFDKFSRLDNALSRKTEGTGLGLFLAKSIIEAHHGSIWFSNNSSRSVPEKPGTTFTFSLPVGRE